MASAAEVRLAIRAVNEASRVLQEVRGDLQSVQREAGVIDRAMGAVEGVVGRLGGALTAPFQAAVGAVRAFGSALADIGKTALGVAAGVAVFQGVGSLFSAASSGVIGMNALLEKSTLQFQTLLGSADAAREHVEGLFRFAAETPFETEPILNASRLLLTFGGTALGTAENLRLVGDAAAVAGRDIGEVAFWVGRAYSAIQAGKPFGEAAMALQEMGVLSATARARIEDLAASGASSAEVWAALREELGRFSGAMKLQAGTWEGLTSTISDNVAMLSATAFRPLFDLLKELAEWLAGVVQSGEATAWAERVAGAIQRVIDTVRPLAAEWLPRIMDLFRGMGEGGALSGIMALLNPLGALAREALPALMPLFVQLGQILADIATAVGPPVAELFQTLGEVIRDVLAAVMPAITPLLQQLGETIGEIAVTLLPPFVELLTALAPVLAGILVALTPLITQGLQVMLQVLPPLAQMLAEVLHWLAEHRAAMIALAAAIGVALAAMAPVPAAIVGIITVVGLLKQHWDSTVTLFTATIPAAVESVKTALTSIPVVGPIIQAFLDTMRIAFETAWTLIETTVGTAMGVIQGIITTVMGVISGDWGRAWSGLQQITSSVWEGIRGIVAAVLSGIIGIIGAQLGLIWGIFSDVWSGIQAATVSAIDVIAGVMGGLGARLRDAAESGIPTVLGWAAALPERILSAVGDLAGRMWSLGWQAIQSLASGITAAIASVVSAARSAAEAAIGAVKSGFGLFSPSRVMLAAGRDVMRGLELGIAAAAYGPAEAMRRAVDAITREAVIVPPSPPTMPAWAPAATMPAGRPWDASDRPMEMALRSTPVERMPVTIVLELGGLEIARAILPDILREAERQGVRLA